MSTPAEQLVISGTGLINLPVSMAIPFPALIAALIADPAFIAAVIAALPSTAGQPITTDPP